MAPLWFVGRSCYQKKRVFLYRNAFPGCRWPGTRRGPFNSAPPWGSIRFRLALRTYAPCGEPNETKKDMYTHPKVDTALARAQVRRMLRSCGSSRWTGPHPRPFNSAPMGVNSVSSAYRGRPPLNGWGSIRFCPPMLAAQRCKDGDQFDFVRPSAPWPPARRQTDGAIRFRPPICTVATLPTSDGRGNSISSAHRCRPTSDGWGSNRFRPPIVAAQCQTDVGQFDFARPPGRAPHGGAPIVRVGELTNSTSAPT